GGAGRLQQGTRIVFGDFVRTSTCPDCPGPGRVVDHPCVDCDGGGRRVGGTPPQGDNPAGVPGGRRIPISGGGHAGALGGRAGDVYVGVRVRPDERFVRDGNDVVSRVDLTIVEAALGKSVEVETLDGPVQVEFEPGTQPGDTKTLRGRGMPVLQGHGRAHSGRVNVPVPRRLTDEPRRLRGGFARASDHETYATHDGFFDRLKSHFH